jgi:CRP-like cAMP-binding protein
VGGLDDGTRAAALLIYALGMMFGSLFTGQAASFVQARGFSQTELVLRMSRAEIGSYLGLKLETVSRAFSKFAEDGLIEVEKRNIRIVRRDMLREIVGRTDCA